MKQTGVESASETGESDRSDPVSSYLSEIEYKALSPRQRNQLALDRWKASRKSSWEIGRQYERSVGYILESSGYRVEYHGAINRFDDLGRELIARRKEEIRIVQCKFWSQQRTIHEKHIFQLFGSVVEFIARENTKGSSLPLFSPFEALANIRPVFVTSTKLSDRAMDFARILQVEVRQNAPMTDYPMIKCNISKRSQERLYHLPFDQQYDRTVIEPEFGEVYAWTVEEAEDAGFRRAFRWKPSAGDRMRCPTRALPLTG